jgi:geranylgeranyl diphosphate synthase type I
MEEITKILSQIKPFIDEEIERNVPKTGDPQVLFEGSWHYISSGGKRIRPAIMALACEALGGNAKDIVPAGAAVELGHTFLLVHDDMEDFTDLRRGKPTMHVKYGTPHAINIGDYLFMKSYEALLRGEKIWGSEKTMKILNYLNEMYLRTGEGQAMEIDQRDKDLSEATFEWYEKMSLHKTGYYSGGIPCAIGAIIANGTDEQVEILKNFGFATAIAFQIQDDILDVIKSPESELVAPGTEGGGLGKDFAGDIKEGKRTLILVHTFQNADENDKQKLKELVGKKDITLEEKLEVIDIFKKYDSINYAKNYARKIIEKAIQDLRKLPENEGRRKLEAMATFLIEREF